MAITNAKRRAYHEAGHVVMAFHHSHLGFYVKSADIRITPHGQGHKGGYTAYGYRFPLAARASDRVMWRAQLRGSLSGNIAEAIHTGCDPQHMRFVDYFLFKGAAHGDLEDVNAYMELLHPRAGLSEDDWTAIWTRLLTKATHDVVKIVQRDWRAVKALAAALVRQRQLTQREIIKIMKDAR